MNFPLSFKCSKKVLLFSNLSLQNERDEPINKQIEELKNNLHIYFCEASSETQQKNKRKAKKI